MAGGKGSSSQAWWDGQWHLGTRQGGGLLAALALDPGLAGARRWVCGHWATRAEVLWPHQGPLLFGTLMGKGGKAVHLNADTGGGRWGGVRRVIKEQEPKYLSLELDPRRIQMPRLSMLMRHLPDAWVIRKTAGKGRA